MKKYGRRYILFMWIFLSLSFAMSTSVLANGWIDKRNKSVYSNGSSHQAEDPEEDDDEPTAFEKYLNKWLARTGNNLAWALKEGEVDLTVDGIILGRMATGVDVSYVQFELCAGNPWGVIGALVFNVLRNAVLTIFLPWTLYNLGRFIFKNGQKERAESKTYLQSTAFHFLLLFMLPFLIDYILYFRDVLLYVVSQYFSTTLGVDTGGAASVVAIFRDRFVDQGGFFNCVLYFASIFAGFFFIANYAGTALVQTGFFGALSYTCIASTKSQKTMSTWASTFIPNVFVPLVDYILLLVPNGIYAVVNAYSGEDAAKSFGVGLIQLFCIWSIIPTRNAIFRGVAGVMGLNAPANGMKGLATMAMLAARSLGRGVSSIKGGSSSGGEKESMASDAQNASASREQAERFDEANRSTKAGMSDVDALLGEESNSSKDISFGNDDMHDGSETDAFLDEMGAGSGSYGDAEDMGTDSVESLDAPEVGLADGVADGSQGLESDMALSEIPDGVSATVAADGTSLDSVDAVPDADTADIASGTVSADTSGAAIEGDSYDMTDADSVSMENDMGGTMADKADSLSPYKNIPNMDDEFAQSLSGADLDRYANLNARDAMRDQVASNMEQMSDINESMVAGNNELENLQSRNAALNNTVANNQADYDGYRKDYNSLQSRNADIDKEMESILNDSGSYTGKDASGMNHMSESAQSRLGELSEAKQNNVQRMAELQSGMDRAQENIASANTSISDNNARMDAIKANQQAYRTTTAKLQARNQRLQNGIENCTNRERQYASNYGEAGMSDKTYANANSFKISKRAQMSAVKNANYKNFDKGNFEQYLTPEQRGQYYHERAMKAPLMTAQKALKTMPKVAGAMAVGTVAAGAALFGGPDAMAAAALGSTMVAKKAGGAVVNGVSNASTYVREHNAVSKKPPVDDRIQESNTKKSSGTRNNMSGVGTVTSTASDGRDLQQKFDNDKRENDRRYENSRGNGAEVSDADRHMQEQFENDRRENDRRYENYRNGNES